jgi:stress-induced morphogen
MVYEALGNKVGNEIHALKLHTKTPEEKWVMC